MLEIQKNIILALHTTFRIGGPAKYFYIAKTKEDIIEAIKTAKENGLPYFILGGGSNLLVSDKGYDGLVIKIQNTKHRIQNTKIITDAGVPLARLVAESVGAGLTGLEWAIGIPGTIGGAVYGNSGAFGHSVSENVAEITTLAPDNFSPFGRKKYNNEQCGFEYRGSIFKKNKEIILEVVLNFQKGDSEKSQEILKENLNSRKKMPVYPSAGSVFKNQEVQNLNEEVLKIISACGGQAANWKGGKIPTGYLIEQCGLKGKEINGAKISEEHANFIVNFNNAKAEDVIALIDLCKNEVKNKFGIILEEEIQYVGF